MANTEKPTTKAEHKKAGISKTLKPQKQDVSKTLAKEKTPQETKDTGKKSNEKKQQPKKIIPKIKKSEVVVNVLNVPISTKYAVAICKFIKGKKIDIAISDLEQVIRQKKAVPMKGEIPHRRGKMMSGRFPRKASKYFIRVLKSLLANANNHDVENPIIAETIANTGSRPYSKFGSIRRKRAHIKIMAKETKPILSSEKEQKKKLTKKQRSNK